MKFFICCFWMLSVALANATIDAALQMQLGNPSGATADTNNHTHYLIQRPIETLDYNDTHGEPNWASWDLTAGDANGTANRQDSFAADTNLPPGFHVVGANDYSGSGYDRGHLCPSGDRTDSTNDNNQTFLMSNMMPQAPDNNEQTWANFENYCRSLCQSTNNYELLIVCGPGGFTGARINTNGYVWIPQFTWKIAVVVPPGSGLAASRITATNRVIALKVPNTNGLSSVWQTYITSASQIEADTGLTFFTALPADVAAALRAKVDGQTNSPPVIYAFSPAAGGSGTNVVISGTNFNHATEVTFNGAPASFLVDSNTQITATVPAAATTGFISVTAPGGTAISTNLFSVSGAGPVYAGVLAGWDVSGLSGFGPSPFAATASGSEISAGSLIRGSGVNTTGSGLTHGGWGGDGFVSLTEAAAVAANQLVTFSLAVSNGYTMSLTSVSRFDYRRSNTGPTNGILQVQVGNGPFADVAAFTYGSSSSGGTNPPVDLGAYGALQNVGAGTNVTFRIVNFNAGGAAGTWYVFDAAGSAAPDLAVQGVVSQVLTNPPPAAPMLSLATVSGGQVQFTLTGAAGANYIIEATANLTAPAWIPLATNAAPFVFTEAVQGGASQRFYRALAAP